MAKNKLTKNESAFTQWDMAEVIDTKEDMAELLKVVSQNGDLVRVCAVVRKLANSKGMSKIAHEIGMPADGLRKSLSEESPSSFDTIFKILDNLGFRLTALAKSA